MVFTECLEMQISNGSKNFFQGVHEKTKIAIGISGLSAGPDQEADFPYKHNH